MQFSKRYVVVEFDNEHEVNDSDIFYTFDEAQEEALKRYLDDYDIVEETLMPDGSWS